MATAQTHRSPSRDSSTAFSSRAYPNIPSMSGRTQPAEEYSRHSPHASARVVEDRKRRYDANEDVDLSARYNSHSPPRSRSSLTQRDQADLTPSSRGARNATGAGQESPRTHLPSFNNLTTSVQHEEEELMVKRRRLEGGAEASPPPARESTRQFSSPHQEYDGEEEVERIYRREMAARSANRRNGDRVTAFSPPPAGGDLVQYEDRMSGSHSYPHTASAGRQVSMAIGVERRNSVGDDDGYDTNLPLARRRGDAAQAKASRLHIDTGSNEAHSGSSGSGGGNHEGMTTNTASSRFRPNSSTSATGHGVAKSAPPHKMTFGERDSMAHFDIRGDAPQMHPNNAGRAYSGNGPMPAVQTYYPSAYSSRKDGVAESVNFNDAHQIRRSEQTAHPSSHMHHTPSSATATHPPQRQHLPPSAGTPLTAMRANTFVPQTATIPSPAYHTTHFVRNPTGGSHGNGNEARLPLGSDPRAGPGGSINNTSNNSGVGAGAMPPRTAGLNPPPTARLPEHLRSPPSSKTHFLALFSNFYDSLTDSRTLKATLEDQVRRSNTLLQTLQKSSRILELTVDRRLREERALWETKVRGLEERCLRLERRLGTGDPVEEEGRKSPSSSPSTAESRVMEQNAEQIASEEARLAGKEDISKASPPIVEAREDGKRSSRSPNECMDVE